MKKAISIRVNGASHSITADPSTPLLYVLRNELQLNGPRYGCGLQQCGACMVLVDGKAQPSCMLPLSAVKTQKITTLEGLSKGDELHRVQEAFVTEQAAQCGYCLNGMVMAAVSLLSENPHPDDTQIREGMQRNLCRCGTYSRIIKAVRRAAGGGDVRRQTAEVRSEEKHALPWCRSSRTNKRTTHLTVILSNGSRLWRENVRDLGRILLSLSRIND